jgi:sulfotransferase
MSKIIFLSGLPRSGSTLLMNILGQNPNISVSSTSGLFNLVSNLRNEFTNNNIINAQQEKEVDNRFSNAISHFIKGWTLGDKVYIDKGRAWPHYYEFLEHKGIEPKIIITVRDIRGVLSSLEKLYRKSNLRVTSIGSGNSENLLTTEQRVKEWAATAPVGHSYNVIKDAFTRGINSKFQFVRFEDLVSFPNEVMEAIYSYINEPNYKHNFKYIKQITHEDDRLHGIMGLHKIHNELKPVTQDWDEIIGFELSSGLMQYDSGWFYKTFYPELL